MNNPNRIDRILQAIFARLPVCTIYITDTVDSFVVAVSLYCNIISTNLYVS